MTAGRGQHLGRLGVLGGTFDPVHIGHLVAAVNVRRELGLDKVLLVVANEPWQKTGSRPVSPAADRYAMVQAAVSGVEGVEASPIEIERGAISYTADTLAELGRKHPASELFLVVGSDLVGELGTWERVDEVRARATLVIVSRPGTSGSPPPGWSHAFVEIPLLDISSTDLRTRARDGRPLDFLVPDGAVRFIRERDLYSVG